jgi:putative glycosyltransferase (TIGR04372 family)
MIGPTSPPDPSALIAQAIIEAAKRRMDDRPAEAVTLLETAIALWPKNGRVRLQYGLALLAVGNVEGVRHVAEAVRQEPGNVERLAAMAETCEAVNDIGAADLWHRRTVARAPTRADLIVKFGGMLLRAGRHREAETWIRRGLTLKTPFGHAHAMLGTVYQRAGRMVEAVESFSQAVEAEPDYAKAYVALAGGLLVAGAPKDEVMKPARIAAERFPGRADVVSPVVQHLRDQGDEEAYVEYATRLVDIEMAKAAADEFGALGFRLIKLDGSLGRIGEIALQLDLHVKMKMLGWLPPFVSLLAAPKEEVCNAAFLDCWRPYVTVVDDPRLIGRLAPLKERIAFDLAYVRMPDGKAISKGRAYVAVQEEWQRQGRRPLLALTQAHVEQSHRELARMGMPEGAWFVSVHVRESGFLNERAGSSEATRNAGIAAYLPAIEEIVRRGGWVVRLGDPTMTPLPPMPQVIDYAVSPHRSEAMDVFLMASCRFFLGTTSGPVMVAAVFGVPIGAANFFPPGEALHSADAVVVPKLCRERATGRILSFEESLGMPLALTYDSAHFASLGLEGVESDAEDIRDLAVVSKKVVQPSPRTEASDAGVRSSGVVVIDPGLDGLGSFV